MGSLVLSWDITWGMMREMRALFGYWHQLDQRTRRQIKMAVGIPFAAAVVVTVACLLDTPTAEFVRSCATKALGLVATPFFFETSIFLFGAFVVVVTGVFRSRLRKGDFVEIAVEPETVPPELEGRATRPCGKTEDVALDVAEGYLNLGLPDEAWDALMRVPRKVWDSPSCVAVRLRFCMMEGRWSEAKMIVPILEEDVAFSKVLAEYEIAHARYLLAGSERGESGNARCRKAEAGGLLQSALTRYPDIRPVIEADELLAGVRF